MVKLHSDCFEHLACFYDLRECRDMHSKIFAKSRLSGPNQLPIHRMIIPWKGSQSSVFYCSVIYSGVLSLVFSIKSCWNMIKVWKCHKIFNISLFTVRYPTTSGIENNRYVSEVDTVGVLRYKQASESIGIAWAPWNGSDIFCIW